MLPFDCSDIIHYHQAHRRSKMLILCSLRVQAYFLLLVAVCSLSDGLQAVPIHSLLSNDTTVKTSSGRYVGHPSPQYPDVTEYLGIGYAVPPMGSLRFAAPVKLASNSLFVADTQPFDCPYVAQPWGSVPGQYWNHADRIMAQESADGYNAMHEDCLKINIWAPYGGKDLPVMMFVYGGGKSNARSSHH